MGNGMTQEDIQRIFTGDQEHMEQCMKGMIDKASDDPTAAEGTNAAEEAVKAAEALHNSICGDGKKAEKVIAEKKSAAKPTAPPAQKPKRVEPEEPKVTIPDHRLQYARDT